MYSTGRRAKYTLIYSEHRRHAPAESVFLSPTGPSKDVPNGRGGPKSGTPLVIYIYIYIY